MNSVANIAAESPEAYFKKEALSLLAGESPNGTAKEAFGNYWHLIGPLQKAHADGGTSAVRTAWKQLVKQRPELRKVVASDWKSTTRKTSFTVAELMDMEFGESRFVVPGLIAEGHTLLAGKAKLGKTYWALNVAYAKAIGGIAFGQVPVDPCGVLYLALEGTNKNLQKRFRALLAGDEPPRNLYMERVWPRGMEAVERLDEWLDDHADVKLVIIDTLKPIRPDDGGSRKTTYDLDYEFLKPLTDLAEMRGVDIIGLHHTNKAQWEDPFDAISGSMGLRGAVDNEAIIVPAPNGRITLHARGRDLEEIEKAFEFDSTLETWTLRGDASALAKTDERQQVLDVLQSAGTALKPTEIASQIPGQKPNNVSYLLKHLLKEGKVEKAGYGQYQHPLSTPQSTQTTHSSDANSEDFEYSEGGTEV